MADLDRHQTDATIEASQGGFRIDPNTAGRSVGNMGKGKLDVDFVIDTTGSMSDKIKALLDTCGLLVDRMGPRFDWTVSVVAFGDLTVPGDRITATAPLRSLGSVKRALHLPETAGETRGIPRYSGGGNLGESSFEALQTSLKLEHRPDAIKIVVLITDEPALGAGRITQVLDDLQRQERIVFVVSPNLTYFRKIAQLTGGAWFEVGPSTDFSRILDGFDKMARDLAETADAVQQLAGGSVREYLRLPEAHRRG
jgi:hypothetical protein